jgi:hypothetical protein
MAYPRRGNKIPKPKINQPTDQPTNGSTNQRINQTTDQPNNGSTNGSFNQPMAGPTNGSLNRPTDQHSLDKSLLKLEMFCPRN